MAIANYPVWTFAPNWSSSVTETLAWLTDVMGSPKGSEQRRSLRIHPRVTIEFASVLGGRERALFDNMLISFGASRWYLPLWHDINVTDQVEGIGSTFINCTTAQSSKMKIGGVACLINESPFHYELIEIANITGVGIVPVAPLAKAWPAGTRIHPVSTAKLTDQPSPSRRSDSLVTAETRFQIIDALPDTVGAPALTEIYNGFAVLFDPPDHRQALQSGYERMLQEIDNQQSVPRWRDNAQRAFSYMQYGWVIDGREQLDWFERLMQQLRGRAIPIWIPTFMEDFILSAPITNGDTTIFVEQVGFTISGGPRGDREHIMIETMSGGRIYRRIVDCAAGDSIESLELDTPIAANLAAADILRICFITLMRQNQDSVQIEHVTDTSGIATALVTFRSAPDTRVPTPGF